MTTRLHTFALEDAARDPGLVIAPAGGGLPRRITGGVDYAALVLALAPSAYYQLGSRLTSNPHSYADSSANGRTISRAGALDYGALVAGHGRGGDARQALEINGSANTWALTAAGIYPEHHVVAGTPATIAFWIRLTKYGAQPFGGTTSFGLFGTQAGNLNTPGMWLQWASYSWTLYFGNAAGTGSAYTAIYPVGSIAPGNHGWDEAWHHYVIRYNGGPINVTASWAWTVDGLTASHTATGSATAGVAGGAALRVLTQANAPDCKIALQDLALWHNRRLTDAEVAALASPSLGRARFSRAFAGDGAVRGVLLPGRGRQLAEAPASSCHRVYLSTGGARLEVTPGAAIEYPVPAGSTLLLDVEATHHPRTDLPYVADLSEHGPSIVMDDSSALPPVSGASAVLDPPPPPTSWATATGA